ncbi:MAG TPA: PAS domain S-box protein [Candidatus Methylomirabilis sp.]|nr:PAS domain S-box protein [Candidatus Methylomirabilis sp.]
MGHGLILGLAAVGAEFLAERSFRAVRRMGEEILQRQQELAFLEQRFKALIEDSADGIVLLDARGTFLYASPSTARLLGYPGEELIGGNAFTFIHAEDSGNATARFADALRHPGQSVRTELRVRHTDGSWRWIEFGIRSLLDDPSVQGVVGNWRDLSLHKQAEEALRTAQAEMDNWSRERTDGLTRANEELQTVLSQRQQAEEAVRESQAQLAAIIGSAREAIISIDETQRIVLFNAAAERMFRVSASEVMGQPVQRFIPEQLRATHLAGLRDFGRTNVERWSIGLLGGATALRADGEEFPMEAAISQVEIGGRKLYTAILRDVTDQKRAEEDLRASREQVRALTRRLLLVREDERLRVAQEIQERLGQALTALKLDLAWLATKLPTDQASLPGKLKAMLAVADSAIKSARRLATDLRPGVLDDLGVVDAIDWQAQEFQAQTSIRCEFASDRPDVRLDPEASTALFRICQECLTNVARHARATRVHIRLGEETGNVVLMVSDDGQGITEKALTSRTSLGLLIMREQACLYGGQVFIVGRPREGTTVTVRIPMKQSTPERASEGRS